MEDNSSIEAILLTGKQLALKLGISRSRLSQLTAEGCPCFFVGKVQMSRRGARPRYDLNKVLAWLEARSTRKGGQV